MDLGLALILPGIGGAFLLTALILAVIPKRKQKKCTALFA